MSEQKDYNFRHQESFQKAGIMPKKVIANITVELVDYPYKFGKFVKTELARVLKEFADINSSAYGGNHQVETYTDKFGNKLTNIVAIDYGFEIPYAKSADDD